VSNRKFDFNCWDFDGDGEALVADAEIYSPTDAVDLAKVELCTEAVEPSVCGWCHFECRTDWEDGDGSPQGGYVVRQTIDKPNRGRGWFKVWIARKSYDENTDSNR